VPESIASPITGGVYKPGLEEFIASLTLAPRPAGFTEATVSVWRIRFEARGPGPLSLIFPNHGRAENGATRSATGCRCTQAQALLNAPMGAQTGDCATTPLVHR
jgi:hypothetical protein